MEISGERQVRPRGVGCGVGLPAGAGHPDVLWGMEGGGQEGVGQLREQARNW